MSQCKKTINCEIIGSMNCSNKPGQKICRYIQLIEKKKLLNELQTDNKIDMSNSLKMKTQEFYIDIMINIFLMLCYK